MNDAPCTATVARVDSGMPHTQQMLAEIRAEVARQKLSARALSRLTGMHQFTIRDALNGAPTTRQATITLLYFKLVLEPGAHATA